MSLLHEIHRQPHHLRLGLWALSVFTLISLFGYFWFTSFERNVFLALHTDVAQQTAFIAAQDERSPKAFAGMAQAFRAMTASIGNLMGIDQEKGFDRPVAEDTVYLLPLSK